MDRREFLTMLAAGLVATLTSCASEQTASMKPPGLPGAAPRTGKAGRPVGPAIPPPRPGPPSVVFKGPRQGQTIALTIDDGYCETCVDAYVAFAQRTGTAITFSPNGTYHRIWDRYADRLRPLIEVGQVQIGNHTWTHDNLLRHSEPAIRDDIERNEEWTQRTFGITSRPWFRPPYGAHNARTDEIAGSLGYTKILMWNGEFGDAWAIRPQTLLARARRYLRPGTIMLGHANHPAVIHLFDEIEQIIKERRLRPVTLDMMFGTSRVTG